MSSKQRQILSFFVLLNLIIYGVLGFLAFVVLPGQQRPRVLVVEPAPSGAVTEVALAPTETVPIFAPAPTSSPAPHIMPTAAPWQEGGAWWGTSTPAPANTPAPWQEGGSWWTTPTAAPTASPTRAVAAATPASRSVSQQVAVNVATIPLPAAPGAPSGDSPLTAIPASDAWRMISPGASVWYKVGKGGDHIDVFLDASPLQGLAMRVFSPSNLDRPIGQGSLERGRLVWSGGQINLIGDWMARVTNGNPVAVQYRLSTVSREIAPCNTYSYWEYIGPNLVYWTACR